MQRIKKMVSMVMNIDVGRLSLAALILWILVMYGHSLTPAVLSSQESSRALILLQRIFGLTGMETGWLTEHMVRKAAHFTEYGIFGVLLMVYLKNRPKRRYGHREWEPEQVYLAVLAVIFVPFIDETLQLFTPGRSAQIGDVWLDMAGSCFGIFLCRIPALLGIRIRRPRQYRMRKW